MPQPAPNPVQNRFVPIKRYNLQPGLERIFDDENDLCRGPPDKFGNVELLVPITGAQDHIITGKHFGRDGGLLGKDV